MKLLAFICSLIRITFQLGINLEKKNEAKKFEKMKG